jgi:hypothetical protein
MPYHPNLGMTEKEYAELIGYYDQIEAISKRYQQANRRQQ